MGKNKKLLVALVVVLTSHIVNGVQVISNTLPVEPKNDIASFLSSSIFLGLLLGGIGGLIAWGVWKFVKKIQENDRKADDLIYKKFTSEEHFAKLHRDIRLKKRNWKTFYFTFIRSEIYANSEDGFKFLGFYNGEYTKKEDFLIINVYHKISFWKRQTSLILIPLKIKNSIYKIIPHKKMSMVMFDVCEGIDEFANSDYYFFPLIRNPYSKEILDFSDYLQTEYIEKYVFRDVIKTKNLEYKQAITDATEMNPLVQLKRKSPNQ